MSSIEAGSAVRHPLYPELGVGRVVEFVRDVPPCVRVEWPAVGQTSTHAVSVLRLDVPRGMVSALALWWFEGDDCDCANPEEDWCTHEEPGWSLSMFSFTIDGVRYLTDRHIALRADRITGAEELEQIREMQPGQSLDGFAEWLTTATVAPERSDRVFARDVVEPLEAAGFLLRPLEGAKPHGICDPDLRLVGLAMPLRPEAVAERTGARQAAL
jgi:hypothetical protein